ncbi:MAG: hypothetical protein AAF483_29855, partial [Planctomycetota bacterium]
MLISDIYDTLAAMAAEEEMIWGLKRDPSDPRNDWRRPTSLRGRYTDELDEVLKGKRPELFLVTEDEFFLFVHKPHPGGYDYCGFVVASTPQEDLVYRASLERLKMNHDTSTKREIADLKQRLTSVEKNSTPESGVPRVGTIVGMLLLLTCAAVGWLFPRSPNL